MAFDFKELVEISASSFEVQDKPLPPCPRPKRPPRIGSIFLPPLMLKGSDSVPSTPLYSNPDIVEHLSPPAKLTRRRCLEQGLPLIPPATRERLDSLDTENSTLRLQNRILYRQNSDYISLLEEYERAREATTECVKHVEEATKVIHELNRGVVTNLAKIEKIEFQSRRTVARFRHDWNSFIDEKAERGIKVAEVIDDIINEYSTEIVIYSDFI